jgi:hypothetical protein
MAEAFAVTPLKTLLKSPFQGPNWRNSFLIGSALTLAGFFIPFIPLVFVYGYALETMRRAVKGRDLELPAWDDWGQLGVDGLRLILVSLVYLLPGTIIFFGGWVLYFAGSFLFPILAGVAGEQSSGLAPILVMLGVFGSLGILMLSMFLGFLLILLGSIPLPVATGHFVARDQIVGAFRVREWWPLLRSNKLGYFAAWVVILGLLAAYYFVISMAYYTLILCCLIPLISAPVSFYVLLIGAALFGQTYRESTTLLETEHEDSTV